MTVAVVLWHVFKTKLTWDISDYFYQVIFSTNGEDIDGRRGGRSSDVYSKNYMKRQNNVAAQSPGAVIKLPRFEQHPSCKMLRNLPNSSQPQFPHLPNDDKNNNAYTMKLLWGLNEVRIHAAWQKCQLLLFLAGTSSVTEQSAYSKSCFFFFLIWKMRILECSLHRVILKNKWLDDHTVQLSTSTLST